MAKPPRSVAAKPPRAPDSLPMGVRAPAMITEPAMVVLPPEVRSVRTKPRLPRARRVPETGRAPGRSGRTRVAHARHPRPPACAATGRGILPDGPRWVLAGQHRGLGTPPDARGRPAAGGDGDIAVEVTEASRPREPAATARDGAPAPAERIAYQPGIDGLRALALLAIFVVHADMGLASGAFLAVSTFFTLSGFLITSLLVIEHRNNGRVDLRTFWSRRRAPPAARLAGRHRRDRPGDDRARRHQPGAQPGRRRAGGADLRRQLALRAERHHLRRPLRRRVAVAALLVARHRGAVLRGVPAAGGAGPRVARRWRGGLATVLGAGVALSLAVGAIGSFRGWDVDRLYFGTDVRSAELLVGALVALWWVPRRDRLSERAHSAIRAAGAVLVVVMLGLIATAQSTDMFWYRGGLVLYALVTATVVLAAVESRGPVRRVLSSRVLVSVGVVSYGAYLFHWPMFVWLRSETGLPGGGAPRRRDPGVGGDRVRLVPADRGTGPPREALPGAGARPHRSSPRVPGPARRRPGP